MDQSSAPPPLSKRQHQINLETLVLNIVAAMIKKRKN